MIPLLIACRSYIHKLTATRETGRSFTTTSLIVDPQLYFNPASTVKLPLAFLALEKLNGLKDRILAGQQACYLIAVMNGQTIRHADSTSENQQPSIGHFIKKAFLVSDNDAYNRLYQFVGQQTINQQLHNKGYPTVRITTAVHGFHALNKTGIRM